VTGKEAFPELAQLEAEQVRVDAYWADDARIDESSAAVIQPEAEEITAIRSDCGWGGIYFGGTAFKKQRGHEREHCRGPYGCSDDVRCCHRAFG